MAKCLHLSCELEAWADGTLRSHWCLEHAWRYNRGDIVANDAQRARLANFSDDLRENNAWYFPLEYIAMRRRREQRVAPWGGMANWCPDCGPEHHIISGTEYCGRHQVARGLLEQPEERMLRCNNWGEPGPGRYLNSQCLEVFPSSIAKRPPGSVFVYCPPCYIRLDRMGAEWRKREGFDF